MRDIFFHSQWCTALSMVAVQWPNFACKPLCTTSYSCSLSLIHSIQILCSRKQPGLLFPSVGHTPFNTWFSEIDRPFPDITFTQGKDGEQEHWNPVFAPPFEPPSNFSDQINDETSPLYLNASVPNTLFTLPSNATDGLSSFAYTIGVRPQDLFGICMSLFLCIAGGTIALAFLIWALDSIATALDKTIGGRRQGPNLPARRYSTGSKDMLDAVSAQPLDEERSHNSHFLLRSTNRFPATTRKHWGKLRPDFSSFHFSVLSGNLVRILMLFHLPITIFSCYQFSLGQAHATTVSVALAAISFAVFSVLIPLILIIRLFMTPTNKLYDETWTLLSLGPLYNLYRHGSQLFACLFFATSLAFGITIGCGQKSGTAQAIVILVIEVVSSLVTSIWLPWGHGASMGLISFLFCVARIVIAVLLVILTPTVSSSCFQPHTCRLTSFPVGLDW